MLPLDVAALWRRVYAHSSNIDVDIIFIEFVVLCQREREDI